MTPEQAKEAITAMYKNDAFLNSKHPDNAAAKEKFMRLQEMVHGTGEANGSVSFGASRR